jgi:mono/diheme cytochrome c family protein
MFVAALGMLVLSRGFAAAADAEEDRLVAAGERILTDQCARCHATGKTGNSPLADAPPFRTLSAKYPLEHLAEALAEGITTGHADMPEFQFSTDEIAGILAHIERISEPTAPR